MPLENLKRWHWILISIVVGLAGAWIMQSMGPRPGVQARTVGAQKFEAAALRRPMFGMTDLPDDPIDVYPSEGGLMALLTLPVPTTPADIPPGVPARLVKKYGEFAFKPQGKPYMPSVQLSSPPHFRLNFAEVDVDLPRLEKATRADPSAWLEARQLRDRLPSRIAGLTSAGVGARAIGEEGATLEFPLQRNPAEITIVGVDAKVDLGHELLVSMNGKPLAPLTRRTNSPSTQWTTTLPAASLVEGTQSLKITRKETSVAIAEILIVNPTYSLIDFLDDAKRANAKLQFAVHTSWRPARMYPIWVIASVIAIGIVWPTVIQMLASIGFAKRPAEPVYDLDRFKGEAESPAVAPPSAPQDDDELKRLEEEMERRLREGATVAITPTKGASETEPIRTLGANVQEVSPAPEEGRELKVFGGEYYPVAKKVDRSNPKGPT